MKSAKQIYDLAGNVIHKSPHTSIALLVDAGKGFFEAYYEYKNVCATEKTKRHKIDAEKDKYITRIKEQSRLFESVISKTFEERSINFKHFFQMLDKAIEGKDSELIGAAMNLIATQIKQNPVLPALQILSDLKGPNVKEIEI